MRLPLSEAAGRSKKLVLTNASTSAVASRSTGNTAKKPCKYWLVNPAREFFTGVADEFHATIRCPPNAFESTSRLPEAYGFNFMYSDAIIISFVVVLALSLRLIRVTTLATVR
jgi:hypothetical protein